MNILTAIYNWALKRSEEKPKTAVNDAVNKHVDQTLGPLVK